MGRHQSRPVGPHWEMGSLQGPRASPGPASCSPTTPAKFRDSPHPPGLPSSRTRAPPAGSAARAAAAAAQALGCSRARERALWRGVGAEGSVAARSLASTLPPPPRAQPPPPPPRRSAPPSPHLSPPAKRARGAHQSPFQAQSAEGGGPLGKGMEAAVSGRLQRGRGLQSREKGRGQSRADPEDEEMGRGAISLQAPGRVCLSE